MTEKKLVLASNNAGKLREFRAMFAPMGVTVLPQGELGVSECAEPFETFIENCLTKARHAARETGLPAMADDSGVMRSGDSRASIPPDLLANPRATPRTTDFSSKS